MNEEVDVGHVDDSAAAVSMCAFSARLSDLPQKRKVYYMEQTILDLMDYTEQSDDEHLWCDLLIEFKKVVKKHGGAIADSPI